MRDGRDGRANRRKDSRETESSYRVDLTLSYHDVFISAPVCMLQIFNSHKGIVRCQEAVRDAQSSTIRLKCAVSGSRLTMDGVPFLVVMVIG